MFKRMRSLHVETETQRNENENNGVSKDPQERELERRAHELSRVTHVLEWQARGLVRHPNRVKPGST